MSGLTCEVVLHPESKNQATVAMFPQAPIADLLSDVAVAYLEAIPADVRRQRAAVQSKRYHYRSLLMTAVISILEQLSQSASNLDIGVTDY